MSDYDYLFKFILIGNSGVGKSCILYQFIENKFQENQEPTIGIEFGTKTIDIKDMTIRTQIWDSAGQENYRSITRSYYRNTICTFLVYDITDQKSFDDILSWYKEAQTYGNEYMRFVLMGNKTDLEENWQVSYKDAEEFAKKWNMIFFESSAKTNHNIRKAFEEVILSIIRDIDSGKLSVEREYLGIKNGFLRTSDLQKRRKKKKCC